MRKTLLAPLLVMVISSWCLAQTDSLPAPTAEPCQPANCNSPCQSGPCAMSCCPAAVAEPFVPKWAVGATFSKLTDIPGKVLFEKLCGKKILQIFLATNYWGEIQPDGKYFDNKISDFRVDLGVTGMKEIMGTSKYFKLYLGLSPEIYYDRRTQSTYSNRDSCYYDTYSIYYGAKLSTFIKASFVKDMSLKDIRFRNEFSIIPVNGYASIRYDKNNYYDFGGEVETKYNKVFYGINLITAGSITYSIKYLF